MKVKRFLSILIALILVLSMFSVTFVAIADELDPNVSEPDPGTGDGGDDEEEARKLVVDFDMFRDLIFLPQSKKIVMNEKFMLDGIVNYNDEDVVWYKNAEILHKLFEGIKYVELNEEKDVVDLDDGEDHSDVVIYELQYDYDLAKYFNDDDATGTAEDETDGNESKYPANPEVKKYQATEIVKLEDAPKVEGYKFAGWKISWDGCNIKEFNDFDNFPAEFEFNMPATKVTVTAKWIPLELDEESEDDEQDGEVGENDENTENAEDIEENKEVKYKDVKVTFYANDAIYLMYCGPDGDYYKETKEWEYCAVDSTFSLTTDGEWWFRFAVLDGEKIAESDSTSKFNKDCIIATTYDNVLALLDSDKSDEELQEINYTLMCYAYDSLRPIVEISDTAKTKQEEGLVVGQEYSISSTSLLKVTDTSSWTATYLVYKKVGTKVAGADSDGWLLIYDSTKDSGERVADGYDNCISDSGRITPLASDVTGSEIYKIIFSVKDNFGYFGIENEGDEVEYKPVVLLKVVEAEDEPGITAVEAWKIVLYVVAGLSAVGIVVLLFVKPKQPAVADDRFNAADDNAENADSAENNAETSENDKE